ncbi:bifunctional adenosylcobinamide kinase/adenosylcobinamide-phosphate guanylyltransferase [Sporosarcina sp. E16_3]|uniref:bifunctional adenosylcobinamide kinase/adenosylcobinamide-phosphate guanylyltransferase n=1 Tax=Sporosarcina sp. E16_3 TaxID=2789293 RepID=UPI001A90D69B|nr:bifunctional adenosylcobinamide kinase/adenosylcobinamide-phosphate guanylyltransferase [Sporosarcina sp. E16_3]MBO0601101.1 bifunctional adenosylcobinamide kinase/adenosylcobinamide-phosphate guanylyltransferase [Sporosarcina sp. E16_3]
MHVYIGGAHNGKRDYVKKWLAQQGKENVQWIEGNCLEDSFIVDMEAIQTTVIAGVEKWLAETNLSEQAAIDYVMNGIAKDRQTVFILTDIGRGIVPMDADQRKLRDACGRLYQRLMAEADEVTRIWYGLAKTLKKRGEQQ